MRTKPDLSAATAFVWRTARLLDRFRFGYLFLGGERGPVLAALGAYQNVDGGFGNALEPDFRGPVSQPPTVASALEVLDEVDAFDDPMVERALDYLQSVAALDGGLPFVLLSVRDYPRAPWWEPQGDDPPGSLLPTAGIVALLFKHGLEHPWLPPAAEFCWRRIDALGDTHPYEVRSVLPFLEHAPDRQRAETWRVDEDPVVVGSHHASVRLDSEAPGVLHAPEPRIVGREGWQDVVYAVASAGRGAKQPGVVPQIGRS